MNLTFTLTQEDAKILRQQVDAWLLNPQSARSENAETRGALQRIAEQFKYLNQEQTHTARG